MKTRVAFFFLTDKHSGGTFQYSITMLRAILLNNKLNVKVFYKSDDFLEYFDIKEINSYRIKQTSVLKIGRALFPVKAKHFDDFDIILSPTYDPLLLGYKGKSIFTLHDLQERYFPENFSFLQKLWRKTLYSALTKNAKAIICESDFVKNDILKYYPKSSIVYVLQAPQMLHSKDQSAGDFYRDVNYFFYPAYFKPHKNHVNLLKAFALFLKKHPGFYLMLTGEKKYDYNVIESLAKDLKILENIIFVGRLDDDSLIAAYKNAKGLIMPSLFESISIPILEAYQLGTPVCSSDVFGLKEQVAGYGYLFDPNDPLDIAEQMTQLIENHEQTTIYKLRAMEHAANVNDLSSYRDKIIEIFNI
ncbi:MAG: glycosyltransferase, family 1 [Mucilaginibacter sp.]|jgi:glycosyltransferase involved in cell wall biosynthesis|nr:glycosyltransferase, family 1 [Mucilaginibacter sp.]